MAEAELIPVTKAAKLVNASPHTLRQLVRDGTLATFVRPLDRRTRLVRVTDVTALAEPRPIPRGKEDRLRPPLPPECETPA
jgi:excisionase family DNA binding protein